MSPSVEIRRCGAGWACCDGVCATCPAMNTTVGTTTTLNEDGIQYTDKTLPYPSGTTFSTSDS